MPKLTAFVIYPNLTAFVVYPNKPRGRLLRMVAWPFVFLSTFVSHSALGVGYAGYWANESLRLPQDVAAMES